MNVAEAMALSERMREAKAKLDTGFNAAYEALNAAIRPHAAHETNQLTFLIAHTPHYSPEELALIRAMGAAGALHSALEAVKDEVLKASLEQRA